MRTVQRKEGRKGWFAAAALMSLASAEVARTQSWSAPFNHNEAHNAYGNWTHPFTPWATTTYLGAMSTGPWTPADPVDPPPEIFTDSATGKVYEWPQPATNGTVFNAVHMSVIPKGIYRGMVLVWNRDERVIARWPAGGTTYYVFQPYAIIDPTDVPLANVRFRNFLLPVDQFISPSGSLAQDLFCAGHAWSPFGDLIVVGGTDYYAVSGQYYSGGKLTFAFNPRLPVADFPTFPGGLGGGQFYDPNDPNTLAGYWVQGPDLANHRWYPTAMLTHRLARPPVSDATLTNKPRMLVLGGTESPDAPGAIPGFLESRNTYEALLILHETDPSAAPAHGLYIDDTGSLIAPVTVWDGCGTPTGPVHVDWLDEYPRCHLLSTGEIFYSGYGPRWGILDHENPGTWLKSQGQTGLPPFTYSSTWQEERHDGTSVLFPNFGGNADIVLRIGGAAGFFGFTTDTCESIATSTSNDWVPQPSLPATDDLPDGGRSFMNVVTLPNGSLLAFGGQNQAPDGHGGTIYAPAYTPLLFEEGKWHDLPPNPTPSQRTYHSTAVLLPDGRVFLGGGDDRDFDYEIFWPAYMEYPQNRPSQLTWQAPVPFHDLDLDADELAYGGRYKIHCAPLPLGHAVAKAVLTAPCSTTHHSDMHQRYIELQTVVQNGNEIVFYMPDATDEASAPPGLYMLWLVTNGGFPSHAKWVYLP